MTVPLPPIARFSASADRNKDHILDQLRACLSPGDRVLEVASGTGQHAIHFTENLDGVQWQTSDRDLTTYELAQTLAAVTRDNLLPPMILDIDDWSAPDGQYEAVFSANCLHIIPEQLVPAYVAGVARALKPQGQMLLYGPFRYGGAFTTPSNGEFNQFLQRTYPGGGIRDFETIDRLAQQHGMALERDTAMPANNQFLIWRK